MRNTPVKLDLTIRPALKAVSVVRRLCEQTLEQHGCDADLVFRLALAVHELLTNAACHGTTDEVRVEVGVATAAQGGVRKAVVRLSNQIDEAHVAGLAAALEAVRAAPDPVRHYRGLVQRAAEGRREVGIGIARVAAESELDIGFETRDGRVTVWAVSPDTGNEG